MKNRIDDTYNDTNRLKLHLMPRTGWLNDPNGLCQLNGIYHVFFQYSPFDAEGGLKVWGHYTSRDLLHWQLEKIPLFADTTWDRDGVYSGSALVEQEKMYLFYTGNVKLEGDYDYVNTGREANTLLVTSEDGQSFSQKKLLMTNEDYPHNYTLHIRDPKVWKEDNTYYMVQGGRQKGDKGAALLFTSQDMLLWNFSKSIETREPFGYMWECPDYFEVDGKYIFSCSPQGLEAERYRYQNRYQSGFFLLEDSVTSEKQPAYISQPFTEWDMGFDFYAPQTFLDEQGRRILIGWAGMPDADYDNEPTVQQGWQHALTLPRELFVQNDQVCQRPVREIYQLRRMQEELPTQKNVTLQDSFFELEIQKEENSDCKVSLSCAEEILTLEHKEGVFSLRFSEAAGRGRKERLIRVEKISSLDIFADTSLLEVYINGGEQVMTSRFYFPNRERVLRIEGTEKNTLWYMDEMQVRFTKE